MMYKFNTTYINLAEVRSVELRANDDPKYPYKLAVYFKDGSGVSVVYTTEGARNTEAWNLTQAFNRTVPDPVSRYEVEQIIHSEIVKCRNDFSRLRTLLKEVLSHGS